MPEYTTIPFEEVGDSYYIYLKLLIDGKSHYDEYVESIKKNVQRLESLASIIAYMEQLSPQFLMPGNKFKHIQNIGRSDVFEFKKDDVRIYVIKQEPYLYVVIGGNKTEQKNTIAKLKRLVNNFPISYTQNQNQNETE